MRRLPKFIWLKELNLFKDATFSKNVYLTCEGEKYTTAFGKRSPFFTDVEGNHEYHDKDSIKRIYRKDGYPDDFINMWKEYDDTLEKPVFINFGSSGFSKKYTRKRYLS